MGKTFRAGHSFPTSAGFSGSSGKVASISPYTRRVPRQTKAPSPPKAIPRGPTLKVPKPKAVPLTAPPKMPDPGAMMKPGRKASMSLRLPPMVPGLKKGGLAKC